MLTQWARWWNSERHSGSGASNAIDEIARQRLGKGGKSDERWHRRRVAKYTRRTVREEPGAVDLHVPLTAHGIETRANGTTQRAPTGAGVKPESVERTERILRAICKGDTEMRNALFWFGLGDPVADIARRHRLPRYAIDAIIGKGVALFAFALEYRVIA